MKITELQSDVTPCRLDPKRSGWMMLKHVRPDDERRQLRVWMRKKQRERMAVYQKQREKLREREHQPFSSSGTTVRCVGCVFISPLMICLEVLNPHCCASTETK